MSRGPEDTFAMSRVLEGFRFMPPGPPCGGPRVSPPTTVGAGSNIGHHTLPVINTVISTDNRGSQNFKYIINTQSSSLSERICCFFVGSLIF